MQNNQHQASRAPRDDRGPRPYVANSDGHRLPKISALVRSMCKTCDGRPAPDKLIAERPARRPGNIQYVMPRKRCGWYQPPVVTCASDRKRALEHEAASRADTGSVAQALAPASRENLRRPTRRGALASLRSAGKDVMGDAALARGVAAGWRTQETRPPQGVVRRALGTGPHGKGQVAVMVC